MGNGVVGVVRAAAATMDAICSYELVPHSVAAAFGTVSLIIELLFFALLMWIVIQGIRRQGVEGWLVLPAVPLRGIGKFASDLSGLRVPSEWHVFGLELVFPRSQLCFCQPF
jgi:hypothetical protein